MSLITPRQLTENSLRIQPGDPPVIGSTELRAWMDAVTLFVNTPIVVPQGDIWRGAIVRVAEWGPSAALLQTIGFRVPAGLIAGPNPTTANGFTSQSYGTITTGAGVNGQATLDFGTFGGVPTAANWWFGNAANLGGGRVEFVWGIDLAVATTRLIVGLCSPNTVITVNEPSTFLNSFFVGADSTDANLQIMSNDGAGTCTKVNLGASFPVATLAGYRAVFSWSANSSSVAYTVARLDATATTATGTIAADLPSNTTFFGPYLAIGNAGTASAARLAFVKLLSEQPLFS